MYMQLFLHRLFRLPKSLWLIWQLSRISTGDMYIDCSYRLVVCKESKLVSPSGSWLGPWDYDLTGIAILEGQECNCSTQHCAPQKVSPKCAVVLLALQPEDCRAQEKMARVLQQIT